MNVSEIERSAVASDDLSAVASLRAVARRYSRVDDETDDLLQDALLEAARAGRADLSQTVNYRWVAATLKKLGAMRARSAARRRMREERWVMERAVAAFSTLRKRLSTLDDPPAPPLEACGGSGLPLGLIRRALLPVVMASGSAGTHDPDGHLMILGHGGAARGREGTAHVSRVGGNISSSTFQPGIQMERSK